MTPVSLSASPSAAAGVVDWRPAAGWGITPLGLPWFGENAGAWSRQPVQPEPALPGSLHFLAACPSGARVCFRTNAHAVHLRVTYHVQAPEPPRNIALTGSRGVEIWVDGAFWSVAVAPDATCPIEAQIALEDDALDPGVSTGGPRAGRRWRELCLYLPYYAPVADVFLGVPVPVDVVPVAPPESLPVVFYGSSITHGACASRSSLTYPARIARALDRDFVNLGMSNGAPPELAALLARVPAAAYVLELGTNFYGSPPRFPSAGETFLDVLRAAHPTTPIIAFGPIASGPAVGVLKRGINQTAGLGAVRTSVHSIVRRRIAAGDGALTFVDGLELLGPTELDALTDDLHPNDHGHALMAERLITSIRRALDPC